MNCARLAGTALLTYRARAVARKLERFIGKGRRFRASVGTLHWYQHE